MEEIVWHKHHLKPQHMGGTNDPSNIIKVNIPLHALLHKLLWEEHGRWQDEIAWKGLSGQIDSAFAIKEAQRNGSLGRVKSADEIKKISDAMKTRIISEDTKKKMSESAKIRANSKEGLVHLQAIAKMGSAGVKDIPARNAKIKASNIGRVFTEEHIHNMRKPKSVPRNPAQNLAHSIFMKEYRQKQKEDKIDK